MTRIYFKPQSCSVRNPRARKLSGARGPGPGGGGGGLSAHAICKEGQASNWRNQLDPHAIEQIADGLEKMVLSWTHPGKDDGMMQQDHHDGLMHGHGGMPHDRVMPDDGVSTPTPSPYPSTMTHASVDDESIFLHSAERSFCIGPNSGPLSALAPAIEDMMRGELIKNCWPSITNGEPTVVEQTHADTSYWYLTPANSLPNCVGSDENRTQNPSGTLYGAITPLDISANGVNTIELVHQQLQDSGLNGIQKNAKNGRKGPRIESMEEASDSDSNIKETDQQQGNVPAEKISYHIKSAGITNWSETIEINGGNRITQLLGKKLTSIGNPASYPPLLEDKEDQCEAYKKKVEELQIALLECAMEYEVKIVEMKMQMLHMKSEQRQHKDGDTMQSKPSSERSGEISSQETEHFMAMSGHNERMDGQRVEYLRKQLCRLQREKLALSRELNELRKRERQFDLQRRSLDDALGRVNALQRELGKREQEIVDCQLREKEVRAQLYEVQLALHKAQAAQIEPRKLLSLLPALREWLQTIKKVPCEPTFLEPHEKSIPRTPPVDSIVCSVTKEIQALQKALSKLASKK